LRGDYFASRQVDDTVERDGLTMTFRGWTYTLQDYAGAFGQAGLTIDAMREHLRAGAPGRYARWNRVPMFPIIRTHQGLTGMRVLAAAAIRRQPLGRRYCTALARANIARAAS